MANDATNGLPYLITWREPVGDRSIGVHYLLPDGRRRRVILDSAASESRTLHKIGMELAANKTPRGRS